MACWPSRGGTRRCPGAGPGGRQREDHRRGDRFSAGDRGRPATPAVAAPTGRSPPAADDLVARLRGKPWDVDGQNPGLVLPVALEDRPRQHRQDVCYLNMLESSALIVGAPVWAIPTRS